MLSPDAWNDVQATNAKTWLVAQQLRSCWLVFNVDQDTIARHVVEDGVCEDSNGKNALSVVSMIVRHHADESLKHKYGL